MVWLRKFGAWFSIALLLSAPALACLDRTDLTPAEQECCKHMAQQCGSAGMPDSHSCCAPTVRSSDSAVMVRARAIDLPGPAIAVTLIESVRLGSRLVLNTSLLFLLEASESPPSSITVLRI